MRWSHLPFLMEHSPAKKAPTPCPFSWFLVGQIIRRTGLGGGAEDMGILAPSAGTRGWQDAEHLSLGP